MRIMRELIKKLREMGYLKEIIDFKSASVKYKIDEESLKKAILRSRIQSYLWEGSDNLFLVEDQIKAFKEEEEKKKSG